MPQTTIRLHMKDGTMHEHAVEVQHEVKETRLGLDAQHELAYQFPAGQVSGIVSAVSILVDDEVVKFLDVKWLFGRELSITDSFPFYIRVTTSGTFENGQLILGWGK